MEAGKRNMCLSVIERGVRSLSWPHRGFRRLRAAISRRGRSQVHRAGELYRHTKKTRDIEPMLSQCWADVVESGPTLNQHWFNVSCLLG